MWCVCLCVAIDLYALYKIAFPLSHFICGMTKITLNPSKVEIKNVLLVLHTNKIDQLDKKKTSKERTSKMRHIRRSW